MDYHRRYSTDVQLRPKLFGSQQLVQRNVPGFAPGSAPNGRLVDAENGGGQLQLNSVTVNHGTDGVIQSQLLIEAISTIGSMLLVDRYGHDPDNGSATNAGVFALRAGFVARIMCSQAFVESLHWYGSMSDKASRKIGTPIFLATILGIGWMLSAGEGAAEVAVEPGKPSFRTPPKSDLQASEALLDYLSSMPLQEEPELPTTARKDLRLTMVDAIGLALDNNLGIKSSYLERISDRLVLATAEDKFNPVISLKGNIKTEGGETSTTTITRTIDGSPQAIRFDDIRDRDDNVTWHTSVGPIVTWLLPTGASVRFDLQLEADDMTERESGTSSSEEEDNSYGGSAGLSISQPLLKGAGIEVNNASIRIAELNDRRDVLSLRRTIETTISRAIREYRAIIQAKAEVQIAEEALASARNNLANNKAEIEEGRLPRAGLVQYETQIRQHQISLKQATTALENSRRNLAKTLGQPMDSKLDTVEFDPEIKQLKLSFEQALPIAMANRSDYKAALLTKESAEIALFLAKNNLLWDVALVAGYHANTGDTRSHIDSIGSGITRSTVRDEQTGWNVGINFLIPLEDNDQAKRALTVAETSLLQAEVALKDTMRNIVLEMRNVITSLNSTWNQMELSDQAYELARLQSEIAREELKYGRTTNFEVISLDNTFQQSKVQKLNTEIEYLNTLTALDQALGTTLKTWNVDIGEPEGQ